MSTGVGGSTPEQELAKLVDMTRDVTAVEAAEFKTRQQNAQALMQELGIDALYLNAGTNLYYFSGLRWYASERMVGAILPVVVSWNTWRRHLSSTPSRALCCSLDGLTPGMSTRVPMRSAAMCLSAWAVCARAPFWL